MKSLKTALACALLVATALIIFTAKVVRFFKVQKDFPIIGRIANCFESLLDRPMLCCFSSFAIAAHWIGCFSTIMSVKW
jgi:hypothetical protein